MVRPIISSSKGELLYVDELVFSSIKIAREYANAIIKKYKFKNTVIEYC